MISGEGDREEKEEEIANKESMVEPGDLWVTQAKSIGVGQPVTGERLW